MPANSNPTVRSQRKRLVVICRDYNGLKDIPFMMNSDDFRLIAPRFAADYTVVGEGIYDHPARRWAVDGRAYHVFSDWSLGEPRKPLTTARRAA
jgi:hypothetical protein